MPASALITAVPDEGAVTVAIDKRSPSGSVSLARTDRTSGAAPIVEPVSLTATGG